MKTAEQWFAAYAVSHQHPTNKAIHWLAVPVIYACVFGLLWQIPMPLTGLAEQGINWALLLAIPALLFYFLLSFTLGVAMTIFTALVVTLLRWVAQWPWPEVWQLSLLLFVVMWILQFVGHKIEGKKPSFFQDLAFLLIGPAWLMSFVLKKLKLSY
ncbi:Mpo1 family 2-hydroxy fatty acid dioxygenase [Arsukibacterium sp.]|uniref:Mpo1 family 2-hydroxy fatty acid dioxygenase n=1 Tax=Arsukibacterium sp. TaxID=1977258 RepID=UPI002FDB95E9